MKTAASVNQRDLWVGPLALIFQGGGKARGGILHPRSNRLDQQLFGGVEKAQRTTRKVCGHNNLRSPSDPPLS